MQGKVSREALRIAGLEAEGQLGECGAQWVSAGWRDGRASRHDVSAKQKGTFCDEDEMPWRSSVVQRMMGSFDQSNQAEDLEDEG